jgi:hypothetical protein
MKPLTKDRKGAITLYIIIGMIIVIIIAAFLYYNNLYYKQQKERFSQPVYEERQTSDFLFVEVLKAREICESEETAECYICGCPHGYTCNGVECELANNTFPRAFMVLFVPINYRPADEDFLDRVGKAIEFMKDQTAIPDESFLIIDKTLKSEDACDFEVGSLSIFADEWHKENFGVSLPAPIVTEEGEYIYNYRVIGLDKIEQDELDCGCGFTYLKGSSIYLGGSKCGKLTHIAAHEFGHTFGLCDEYDTCVWENTDERMKCENTRPDKYNSDCGDVCCNDNVACCYGKYAKVGFNFMGSANMPPEREINFESKTVINSYVCENLGIC